MQHDTTFLQTFDFGVGGFAGGANFVARGRDRRWRWPNPAILESNVAYLRVGQVAEKSARTKSERRKSALAASNKIAGTVLDLRFADGDDLAFGKATADLFASKKLPLAILVNGGTRGAAAALAAELRAARAGLIFEQRRRRQLTTGHLRAQREIRAMHGERKLSWKIPTRRRRRTKPIPARPPTTSLPFVDHTSEADLVRAKIKDGDEDENPPPPRAAEPQKPFIRDPVLARAVDLIKGLAVVPRSRIS